MTLELLYNLLEKALEDQVAAFVKELTDQGHKVTGKLIRSLRIEIDRNLRTPIKGAIFSEKYGIYLDKGVKANRVKYSPYVLLPWAKRIKPSLSKKELKSFIFAVWTKHKKEGIPTRNSYKYSKNGFRKKWISRGIEAAKLKVDAKVTEALSEFTSALVRESFQNLN